MYNEGKSTIRQAELKSRIKNSLLATTVLAAAVGCVAYDAHQDLSVEYTYSAADNAGADTENGENVPIVTDTYPAPRVANVTETSKHEHSSLFLHDYRDIVGTLLATLIPSPVIPDDQIRRPG